MRKLKDERIIKEANAIRARLYFLMIILTLVADLIKFNFFKRNIFNYSIELVAILSSGCYIIFMAITNKVSLLSDSDDCIKELKNKWYSNGFAIYFYIFIFGELILMMISAESFKIIWLYVLVWLIPSLIFTIKAVKEGLILWGGKSRKENTLSSFRKRVMIGSLFFGVMVRFEYLWIDGKFQQVEILRIIIAAIMWGIPFYFIMKLLISTGEKNSDKNLKK